MEYGSNAVQAGYMVGLKDAGNADSFGSVGGIIKVQVSPLEKAAVLQRKSIDFGYRE